MQERKGGTFSTRDYKTLRNLIVEYLDIRGDSLSEEEQKELINLHHRLSR